jgi:signal transduction histidine kinase
MRFKDLPIKQKLMRFVFLISSVVLVVTITTFFIYEYYKFRETSLEKISTLGKIVANNGTAALAFSNKEDAAEILASLRFEPHIVGACFYDRTGNLFSMYSKSKKIEFPAKPGPAGYKFTSSWLEGNEPVIKGDLKLGTLYLRSDLNDMVDRMQIYLIITFIVIIGSFFLSYFLSLRIQKSITNPVLSLAGTARLISEKNDYSVRAVKSTNDEIGSLTDAFNHMLQEIHTQSVKLKNFNLQLEQKVSDRTRDLELSNKELEEARQRAESADKLKTSFLLNMSHELRTPLNSIIGFSGILLRRFAGPVNEEQEKQLEMIQKSGRHLLSLINDILDISKIDAGELKPAYEIFNLLELIEEVQKLIQPFADSKGIPVSYIKDQRVEEIESDRKRVSQILINLLNNAIKFTEKGTVTITLCRDGNLVITEVKDTGIGIREEDMEKLFNPFLQLENSLTRNYEGSGLGLSITKKLLDLLHGSIQVKSEFGKGSTFIITLPIKRM